MGMGQVSVEVPWQACSLRRASATGTARGVQSVGQQPSSAV
jgi:hypothetical protein